MGGPTRATQDAPAIPGIDPGELQAVYQTIAGLTLELAGKASSADLLAAINGKASSADLAALVATIAAKASAADLTALAQTVGSKAAAADLTALAQTVGGKAAAADLTALATTVGAKAQAADLTAALLRITAVETLAGNAATAAALTAATARITTLEGALATVPQFVSSSSMLVEDLLSTYPANATRRGKYARVTNFGGAIDRVLRCDYDQNLNYYFWTPTRGEYGRTIAMTADMTLKRLLSPSSVVLSGTVALGITRNVTIDTANATPGEVVEIKAPGSGILGTLNILGTGLGSGVGLLAGNYQKYMIDGSSGSLQVVRLV